jgi:hypothetical protein
MGRITGAEYRVHWYIRKYGLDRAETEIRKDHRFYPELRDILLKYLYSYHEFYPFKRRERQGGT